MATIDTRGVSTIDPMTAAKEVKTAKGDTRGIFTVDPKVELNDYSGPFKPDLRYSDFSREQLARMYEMANDYFIQVMLAWIQHVVGKYGMDAMTEAMRDVWVYKMGSPFHRIMTKGLNIPGNDIESLMKSLQVIIEWGTACFDVTFEMPSKDRGVITCNRCLAVEMIEAYGLDPSVLKTWCDVDVECFEAWAKTFNPNMVSTCLALPPRKSEDDICCKWEYTYKSK